MPKYNLWVFVAKLLTYIYVNISNTLYGLWKIKWESQIASKHSDVLTIKLNRNQRNPSFHLSKAFSINFLSMKKNWYHKVQNSKKLNTLLAWCPKASKNESKSISDNSVQNYGLSNPFLTYSQLPPVDPYVTKYRSIRQLQVMLQQILRILNKVDFKVVRIKDVRNAEHENRQW